MVTARSTLALAAGRQPIQVRGPTRHAFAPKASVSRSIRASQVAGRSLSGCRSQPAKTNDQQHDHGSAWTRDGDFIPSLLQVASGLDSCDRRWPRSGADGGSASRYRHSWRFGAADGLGLRPWSARPRSAAWPARSGYDGADLADISTPGTGCAVVWSRPASLADPALVGEKAPYRVALVVPHPPRGQLEDPAGRRSAPRRRRR
jgi:hypothetical protein